MPRTELELSLKRRPSQKKESLACNVAQITTVPQSLRFLRGQISYLRGRGIRFEAIASAGTDLDTFSAQEGTSKYAVEMERRITPVKDIRSISVLVRHLLDSRPAIVHAHTPKGGLLGMISARLARVPVRIYHIRGLPYMAATGKRRLLLKTTERISCLLADRVFCVSHSIREVAIADRIVPADKIVVFAGGSGNGVDASGRFNPDRIDRAAVQDLREQWGLDGKGDQLTIGFIGRIVRDKGIVELAGAWAAIRDAYPAARLLLVGPIEPQDPVPPDILAQLRGDPRVIMTGSVPDTSLVYPLLDLVVLPSYREGLPNVPLEAAAMELPVVATRIPGCIDAIADGTTGTLVPVKDLAALTDAIRRYLDDPELRRRHGAAGRERVLREFRQEVIWEATFQEYCRLLSARGLPLPSGAAVSCASATPQ